MSEKSEATFHMRKHKVTHVRKKQSDIFVKKRSIFNESVGGIFAANYSLKMPFANK